MSISIGNDSYITAALSNSKGTAKTSDIENKLSNLDTADDEELMEACKSFETYFVEKVLERTRTAMVGDDEDKNEYEEYFGDMLYKEYAEDITESGQLGIAQMLYDSMKKK